jgi:hypothetical protein
VKAPFIFDTNSISVLKNYYPEQFPTFWQRFDDAVADGTVVSCREVFNELKGLQKGWLFDWSQTNKAMFRIPTDEETTFLGEIFKIGHFQTLVGQEQQLRGKPVADPFIVAAGKVFKGCVVTEELLKPNASKIPNVCQHFEIDYTNVQGFMKAKGWTF